MPLLLDLPAARARRAARRAPPAILTVGRIVPNKRIDDVLRAFALLPRAPARPDATLALVGSDEGFERTAPPLEDLGAAHRRERRALRSAGCRRRARRL